MKKNNKGFTLAELLIVVAIIAVLVAVAIPTFMGQLNKAKVAADQANLRAAYADASAQYLTDSRAGGDADVPIVIKNVLLSGVTGADNLKPPALSFVASDITSTVNANKAYDITFTFNGAGGLKSVSAAASA